MSTILVYRLQEKISRNGPCWALLGETGEILDSGNENELERLRVLSKEKETVGYFICPSKNVLFTSVTLPEMSETKLLQAVGGLIENSLVQPIETQHFALGVSTKNNQYPVAVVEKNQLKHWLKQIKALNFLKFNTYYLYPEIFFLPKEDSHWSVYIEQNYFYLKTDEYISFSMDKANLDVYLSGFFNQSELSMPTSIDLFYTKKDSDLAYSVEEKLSKHLRVPFKHEVMNESFTFLIKQTKKLKGINLLQGNYQPNLLLLNFIKYKKWIFSLVLGFLFLHLTSHVSQRIYLSKTLEDITLANQKLYAQVFQNTKKIRSPKVDFMKQVDAAIENRQEEGFRDLFNRTAIVLTPLKTIEVQAIEYMDKKITYRLSAPNFKTLDDLIERLNKTKLRIEKSEYVNQQEGVQTKVGVRYEN